MQLWFSPYVREHVYLIVFVSILFLIGVGFGAVLVNELTYDQKQDMTLHLSQYFKEFSQELSFSSQQSLMDTIVNHAKWIFFIWIFGLSIIGIPLILLLDFLKGVFVGFTVGVLVAQQSWKGLCFAIISLAPHNLIVIPALLICSVAAIAFSLHLVRHRLTQRTINVYASLWKFTSLLGAMTLFLIVAAAWEVYVAPLSLQWMMPKLGLF